MSCGCTKPDRTPLWTPIPAFRQPTDIQPGENIDCYMKRSGSQSGLMNDVGAKTPDRIDNTSLTSDLNLKVDTTFILTPGSDRTATTWQMTVDGNPVSLGAGVPVTSIPNLLWDSTTGHLTGTVDDAHANQNYKVLIAAQDVTGEIDSREYNFYPKKAGKDDTIKFVIPLDGNVHVTCGFGPRKPPAAGASSDHKGMDFARLDHSTGNILASADGTVTRCGPGTGWGNVIFIEHRDGQEKLVATTVYGHWQEAYVRVGQKVAAGQKIALEGNVGIGSGKHLHFELHKGKFGNPTDPAPYLNGTVPVATNNSDTVVGPDGTAAPTGFTTQSNSAAGMTSGESSGSNADCPDVLPQEDPTNSHYSPPPTSNPSTRQNDEVAPLPPSNNVGKNRSSCAPATTPSSSEVIAAIQQACSDAGLSATDTKFIQTVATIESNLDPYAKNPTSSATGLYQFLDAIAVKYYGQLGIPPTCANRCDPYKATQAMIKFYQAEFLPYYNGWLSSGKTKIANKTIVGTDWSVQYPNFTQGEFMYGLIHHDGVGNAVQGKDLGGVRYWRSKVGTA